MDQREGPLLPTLKWTRMALQLLIPAHLYEKWQEGELGPSGPLQGRKAGPLQGRKDGPLQGRKESNCNASCPLHRLPNLAENNDVIKEEDREVLPVQMISKFGEGEEEEEEEEDSGVVSSGINQLRRALSVISLEGIQTLPTCTWLTSIVTL